jgi:hypothetical protein
VCNNHNLSLWGKNTPSIFKLKSIYKLKLKIKA